MISPCAMRDNLQDKVHVAWQNIHTAECVIDENRTIQTKNITHTCTSMICCPIPLSRTMVISPGLTIIPGHNLKIHMKYITTKLLIFEGFNHQQAILQLTYHLTPHVIISSTDFPVYGMPYLHLTFHSP